MRRRSHVGDILREATKLAGKPYPNQIWEQDEAIFDDVDFVDDDDESLEDELETDESETETSEGGAG